MSDDTICPACNGTGKLLDPKVIGLKMAKRRRRAKLFSADVAKHMKISISILSELENGKRTWTTARIAECNAAIKELSKR